jgi:hypothetical protein
MVAIAFLPGNKLGRLVKVVELLNAFSAVLGPRLLNEADDECFLLRVLLLR